MSWGIIVFIACCCLLLSAFVSGSEIAYFGLSRNEIEEMSEDEDDPASQKACTMLADSERLLATILISNNIDQFCLA